MQLTTSCDYPVSADLDVVTDSPRIRKHRAMNLQLLLRRAPDAPALRQLAAQLGVTGPLFAPVADAPLPDCILCELCVRVCSTLGYNALAALGRGDHKSVGPPFGQTPPQACVGCGACVEACPTELHPHGGDGHHAHDLGPHLRTLHLPALRRPIMTGAHAAAMAAETDLAAKSERTLRGLQDAHHKRAPRFAWEMRPRLPTP